MKKAAALILVLTMVLALCACSGSKNPLIGTWEGNYGHGKRTTLVITDSLLEFTYSSGEQWAETYSLIDSQHIKMDGKVFKYTVSGNTLTFYFDEVRTFTRVR